MGPMCSAADRAPREERRRTDGEHQSHVPEKNVKLSLISHFNISFSPSYSGSKTAMMLFYLKNKGSCLVKCKIQKHFTFKQSINQNGYTL